MILRRPERVAAVEEVDLGREPGQERRLLERGVAAADDGDLLSLKKKPSHVAQARHAAAAEAGLAVEAEPHRRSAGRDDDGLRRGIRCRGPRARKGRSREVDPVDVDVDDVAAEALGLLAERGHQLGALDAVREARVVLDVARDHQLAAGRGAGEDDRLEVGSRRIDRGGQAGRARSRR